MNGKDYDVVVVGAGLAGLMAARQLRKEGKSVVVVEARDRVGGRTLSQKLGRDTIDLGAQWVGPDQKRVLALAKELGVETFLQYIEGRKVLEDIKGRVKDYPDFEKSMSIIAQLETLRTIRRFDAMMEEVPLEAPWTAKKAAEWDSLSVKAWADRNVRMPGTRMIVDAVTRTVFSAEPQELSFLFFLFYLRSGKGFESLMGTHGAAQEARLKGGAQQLSERLAEPLGEDLVLEAPVRSIEQSEAGVTVRTDKGAFGGRYCVVAIPPALSARIHYSPTLPTLRDHLSQRMPMGSVIKCVAAYERPFWRDRGLSGEGFSEIAPLSITFDDSPEDASQGALVGFILGDQARKWTNADEGARKQAVLESLVRMFGEEAGRPIEYADKDWPAEEWSRGCYEGLMAPGVMTAYGRALREPCGRIHWAGTETAMEWAGYMDGALESGERAAHEVLNRLERAQTTAEVG